ncbi:MAG: hypothetical protein DI535_07415 [Citrobacter freundii]|nr:MAG: hypothetical protein DI535_07415 [Citrobacter freundii]
MEYLLFFVYLILFSWLVTRTVFFKRSGLNNDQLIILFLAKVIIGIFYGWIGIYYGGYAEMVDTWGFHYQSLQELKLLSSHPHEYFTNILPWNRSDTRISEFLGSDNSYWNDLKSLVFIKLLSVFDIFSMGNYYVNVIFYSYITLFGPIALYRVFREIFTGPKIPVLLGLMFVPSFLYWTSGIHKEGLIFLAVSLIIYHVYFAIQQHRWSLVRIAGIALGLLIILLMRNFLLVLIAPALLAWLLASKWPEKKLTCFAVVYIIGSILFFTLHYVHPKLNFPEAVVEKQQAFLLLQGTSSIPIRELQPTLLSFIINTPQAIILSTLRPYPGDIHHFFSMAAAVETLLILLLLAVSLIWRKKTEVTTDKRVVYFCVFFAISVLITIGFSVNNLGAIVRYRSIIIPLVVPVMIAYIDWDRVPLPSFFNIRKINNPTKY